MNPCYTTVSYTICPDYTVGLKGGRYEASPGKPGGPSGVHHTVVNVPTEPPRDYLIWSLCSFIYGNIFCLGLAALVYSVKNGAALIYSIKARDRKMVGDEDGAKRHASTAHALNIVATVLTFLAIFLSIVVPIAIVATNYSYRYRYRGYN